MRQRRTCKQKPVTLHPELKRLLLTRRREDDILTSWPKQTGGGVVSQNGFRYDYREYPLENAIVIRGGRTKGKQECFFLLIEPDNTAILQGIKAGEDCSLDGGANTKNMLKATFRLAKEKGATEIQLADDAKKYVDKDKDQYFFLSDMYFLTTGYSWYESAGVGVHPTAVFHKAVEDWRNRVRTNTWVSVVVNLPQPVHVPVDISDIDVTASGSAMIIFKRIKEANTTFFADYMAYLPNANGIGPMRSISWVAEL